MTSAAPAPARSQVSPEDFAEILRATREFVRSRVMPRENEIMAADALPADLRAAAAGLGLFGFAIPQEWGGLGLDLVRDVELAMELGYTSLALRSLFGTNNGIAGQVLVNFGTDEQKAAWLERLASGEVVASFALTEPGAGSNPAGLRTRAVRDSGEWVISGAKRFITTRRSPGCSSSSPAPARPRAPIRASPFSSCQPAPPAWRSARTTARWATRAPGPPMSR